jgi:elongation factor P
MEGNISSRCEGDFFNVPKIDTSGFKNGVSFILDGEIFTIVWFQHHKPGKGGAVMRTKLRNLRTGGVVDRTFNAGEKFEQAILSRYPMSYLYNLDGDYVLMHPETFEQVNVTESAFGDAVKYLKDGMEVTVLEHDGKILGAEVPFFVELEVIETAPDVRGDTASGGGKPATLETGAVITVPFFVNVGEKVKLDTRTDTYLERVK